MKLKSITLSIALLLSMPLSLLSLELNHPLLNKVDGLIVDSSVIAMILQYKLHIDTMLRGKALANGERQGIYLFNNAYYTLKQLVELETKHGSTPEFRQLLKTIRNEFEKISQPFKERVMNFKSIAASLIKKSCELRGHTNSLLYKWGTNTEVNEYVLFDQHVKNLGDFEVFLVDLSNFLVDMVDSCKTAKEQFDMDSQKFFVAKDIILKLDIPQTKKIDAVKKINPLLKNVKLNDITESKVRELLKQL